MGYLANRTRALRSPLNGVDVYTVTVPVNTLPGYSAAVGNGSVKTFIDTAKAYYNFPTDTLPVNAAELQALARQIATDYVAAQNEGREIVYPGVVEWQPEGVSDLLVTLNSRKAQTRIRRQPWNFDVQQMDHGFPIPPCSGASSGSSSSESSSSSGSLCPSCCNVCPEVPFNWCFTVSGVTDGICTGCDFLNRSYMLAIIEGGADCMWQQIFPSSGISCNTLLTIQLWWITGATPPWQLYFLLGGSGLMAKYTGNMDCLTGGTLDLASNTADCSNWPATVTISPC